jgi:ferredoxin-NADP reductase
VNQRQAQASVAASNGISLVKPEADTVIQPVAENSRLNFKTAIFVIVSSLGAAVMIVRRPGKIPISSSAGASTKISREAAGTVQPSSPSTHGTVILKLVRITRQTPDAKTLRFTLAENRHLAARPGQFLTFSFLFDGKKVVRSYSICSSPAAAGYVEIPPKRMEKGCASIYLNDRAEVGMTVEASGPYGQFCFDEAKHKRVVLIAGGSGITPMMAMLRHIDDYCLPTSVTLLYSVRTNDDIIFRSELEVLRARLNNFQYHILFSQPPAEWDGPKGRLNREFVESTVKEPASNFFLFAVLAHLWMPPVKSFPVCAWHLKKSSRRALAILHRPAVLTTRQLRKQPQPLSSSALKKLIPPVKDRPCCRQPNNAEWTFLQVAGRDNAEPAKSSFWKELYPWMRNRDFRTT